MTEVNTLNKSKITTQKLVFTALMTALVFVATYSIRIPSPFTSGYVHPGDSMVVLAGLLLGPLYGAFAAGVGSALTDAIAGYTMWIIPTLIIKSLMGFVVGYITIKVRKKSLIAISSLYSIVWVGFCSVAFFLVKQATEGSKYFDIALTGLQEEAEAAEPMANAELLSMLDTTSFWLIAIIVAIPLLIIIILVVNNAFKEKSIPLYISISYVIAGTFMCIGYRSEEHTSELQSRL